MTYNQKELDTKDKTEDNDSFSKPRFAGTRKYRIKTKLVLNLFLN